MKYVAEFLFYFLLVLLFILLTPLLFVGGLIIITIDLLFMAYYATAEFMYNRKNKGGHFSPA
jgi:hypothetical protein